ncbi:MAG TPA: hypothetical protein VFS20_14710 [Longimicrobium sp.]|nr:hypothetical protein [Longimicrobium sp.]
MVDSRLPDEVRALVQNHLSSMTHLEALILLSGSPDTALTAHEIAQGIGSDPDTAVRALRDLRSASLVAEADTEGGPRYRFAPGSEALRHAAGALSEMYTRFPVQVIRAVYERPSPVQQLADAFRVRK